MPTKPETLLDVHDLQVHFALRGGFGARVLGRSQGSVKAVDGVTFGLRRGEVLGLVGESGSGKTTLGRAILRLVPPTGGSVQFQGEPVSGRSEAQFRPLRRRMQMIFQDPHAALNPSMDIGTAVGHPLQIHGLVTDKAQRRDVVAQALERVGLAPANRFLDKFPADLSGGQKQRAVIARAIILNPELIIADEPVSMLDMSVRSKILQLMIDLKRDLDLTYLYITHDLATAKFFCDRIAIMYLGRIVEIGPAEEIYADPKHPYTRSLLKAIPDPDPDRTIPRDLPRGEVPDAVAPPAGCSFHPRCPAAFERCGWESRDLSTMLEHRWMAGGEELFETERALIGDPDRVDAATRTAHVPAGSGHRPEEVAHLLEAVRAAEPDEPFWKGVQELAVDETGVTLSFHDRIDPGLMAAGRARVACLLYGEEPHGASEPARDLAG